MVESGKPHIASVIKAFAALTEIAQRADGMSARELSDVMGTPVPTTYHLLKTLVEAGAVVKLGQGYRLGPLIGVLSDAYLERGEPVERLEDPLRALAAETGETAYLSAWRHGEIEVVATAEGRHAARVMGLQRGSFGHAHARASGKVLLAYARPGLRERYLATHSMDSRTPQTIVDPERFQAELEKVRGRGYGVDQEEFELDVSCVAAPVFSAGRIIGTFTLSSPTMRFERTFDDLVGALLRACKAAEDLVSE